MTLHRQDQQGVATGSSAIGKKRSLRTIYLPNSSPVPNFVFDEILCDSNIPHAARSVLLFLLRKTVGWDNRTEELSLTEITSGCSVTRPTAIHALRVICDCWNLFRRSRGRKGAHASVYSIGASLEAKDKEAFMDRYFLMREIYGTSFPTPKDLRERPCTPELIADQVRKNEIENAKEEIRARGKNILPMR